eukprot:scaffold93465_cov30-Tisochrysis_lutea.AAC.1
MDCTHCGELVRQPCLGSESLSIPREPGRHEQHAKEAADDDTDQPWRVPLRIEHAPPEPPVLGDDTHEGGQREERAHCLHCVGAYGSDDRLKDDEP